MTLETDVAEIREQAQDTLEIYRQVCGLLFFRYGETPTANRVYALVRKGTMATPAKAVRAFWDEMRKKSRVDLGQPDLPPVVAKNAGELVASLWRLSSDAAEEALEAFREEARSSVDAASARLMASQSALDGAQRKAVADAERIGALEAALVDEQKMKMRLREELAGARSEAQFASVALADARRDFSGELEKLRQSFSQSEQRLTAAEKRALMEIEGEREAANRARRDLQAAKDRLDAAEATHRAESESLRDSLATAKTSLGIAEQRCVDLEARIASLRN